MAAFDTQRGVENIMPGCWDGRNAHPAYISPVAGPISEAGNGHQNQWPILAHG